MHESLLLFKDNETFPYIYFAKSSVGLIYSVSHETNSHLHTIFENDAIKTRVLQRMKFEVEKLR